MDHNEGSGVNGHGVTGAHNHAGGTGRDPFHDDVHLSAERFQGVVDSDPGVEVAAAAVQLYGDAALVFDSCQILHEALRRDVEAGLRFPRPPINGLLAHNVAVEGDLALVLADARHVPELCRGRCLRCRCWAHAYVAMFYSHWLALLWLVLFAPL